MDTAVPTPTLLICSVGGAPAPIIKSIKHWRPEKIIFIVSESSLRQVEGIRAECPDIPALIQHGQIECLELLDPQDFDASVSQLIELGPVVRKWKAGGEACQVIVDFTGGTKCMSAGLALAAQHWPCGFSYVGGHTRDKEGLGIVQDGAEQVVHHRNPAESLGRLVLEEALTLFQEQGAYAAAAMRLKETLRRMDSPARKQEFSALAALFDAYAAWHRFDHQEASRYFGADFAKSTNHLKAVLGADTYECNQRIWKDTAHFLKRLTEQPGNSREKIIDLLANADRCAHFGFYDDAVARLYRATEAYAQWELGLLQFTDTGNVAVNQLPRQLKEEWGFKANKEGFLKLGLQDDYRLLNELNHAAGHRFYSSNLDRKTSPLTARNQSLLAHGFQPVGKPVFGNLRKALHELVQLPEVNSPAFPQLRLP